MRAGAAPAGRRGVHRPGWWRVYEDILPDWFQAHVGAGYWWRRSITERVSKRVQISVTGVAETRSIAVAQLGSARDRVARRAGHGVAVLLKVYAHCIDGQASAANRRINDALDTHDSQPDPADEGDGEDEQAS